MCHEYRGLVWAEHRFAAQPLRQCKRRFRALGMSERCRYLRRTVLRRPPGSITGKLAYIDVGAPLPPSIPEPECLVLFGVDIDGLGFACRRRG